MSVWKTSVHSMEDTLLKSHRRIPLCSTASLPVKLNYGRADIHRILPHREPFLLVDRLTGLDRGQKIIAGEYFLSSELPLFRGHFPDYPIYPGTLQVEAIGQLGLCLGYFIDNNTNEITSHAKPPNIRATCIKGAYFREEVKPGDTITLIAKVVDSDIYFGTLLGQSLVNGRIATSTLLEVTFLD